MGMKKRNFGKATMYVLENESGMKAEVSDYGATLCSLFVPNQEGTVHDVVLGYDNIESYDAKTGPYFGATVGRNANRIANGEFALNGVIYKLDQNNGENNLHGGYDGYCFRMWEVKDATEQSVTFALHSEDGDQGFPGELDVEVTYTLTEDNQLRIHYLGKPKATTIINMTNHSYFNLNGHDSGDVLKHHVQILSDAFTPTNENLIPTGEIVSVDNTPMDFREKKELGRDIKADFEPLKIGSGYDHNWCLKNNGKLEKVAEMEGNISHIKMEVYTDLPGVQIYTANFVQDELGKNGVVYQKHQGVCFETQFYPDAVNQEHFQKPIFTENEKYDSTTIYKFSW